MYDCMVIGVTVDQPESLYNTCVNAGAVRHAASYADCFARGGRRNGEASHK